MRIWSTAAIIGALALGVSACSDSDDPITGPESGPIDNPANDDGPAGTTEIAPNVYLVPAGVEFELGNIGASDYLFSWSDAGGDFVDVVDPTLVLVTGETYTFRRTTSAHPFRITTDALPVQGSDGSYARATSDGAAIDAVSLDPIEAFTADPAPTTDVITWTPGSSDVGDYFYTCRVTSHVGMTGAIEVQSGNTPVSRPPAGPVRSPTGSGY